MGYTNWNADKVGIYSRWAYYYTHFVFVSRISSANIDNTHKILWKKSKLQKLFLNNKYFPK